MTVERGEQQPAPPAVPHRAEVAPPTPATAPTTGTLVVHATYQPDGAAAADLILSVRPVASESPFDWTRASTDEHGIARIADLAPGEQQVLTARNWRAGARTTVVAGAQQRVELALPEGIRIRGLDVAG